MFKFVWGGWRIKRGRRFFQVNPGCFRQEFKHMWKNLNGSKISDVEGCRPKNVWKNRIGSKMFEKLLAGPGKNRGAQTSHRSGVEKRGRERWFFENVSGTAGKVGGHKGPQRNHTVGITGASSH